jgi:hypothetical protein
VIGNNDVDRNVAADAVGNRQSIARELRTYPAEARGAVLSEFDVRQAADAMMHAFGEHAELQAARYADLMLGYSNRPGLLIWARIWRTIAELQPRPTELPH